MIDHGSTAGELREKTEGGEIIDCSSTAGGPHLNGTDLRRAYLLRRYARLCSCCVNDTGD